MKKYLVIFLLFIWLGPAVFMAAVTEFSPGACRIPFYAWLAVWPIFPFLPDDWKLMYIDWTFALCR